MTFYQLLTIAVLSLIILMFIGELFVIYVYIAKYRKFETKLDKMDKAVSYMNRLFHDHFKLTDEYIKDMRKERKELKKKIK